MGLYPKITIPTRLTHTSNTLIDNIFSNDTTNNGIGGVLVNHISDHQCIFYINSSLRWENAQSKYIKRTSNGPTNLNTFLHELQNIDFISNMCTTDRECPTHMYNTFISLFTQAKSKYMPTKLIKFNKYKHRKNNWTTVQILDSIKEKDKLYRKFIQTPKSALNYANIHNKFTKSKQVLKKQIKSAKRIYIHKAFNKYKNDPKNTWKLIKKSFNNKSVSSHLLTVLDGKPVKNSTQISNIFNTYFSSIGPSLAAKIIAPVQIKYTDYLPKINVDQFRLKPVNNFTIIQIIDSLKTKPSCGYDDISNILLKHSKYIISHTIATIINQTIKTGIFPDKLKIAKVIALPKSNNYSQCSNYRPISLLSVFSKIFEKVIYIQIVAHFNKYNLLSKHQYGFRNGFSTELAALELVDRITQKCDSNDIPINIYLDLSKAFDTLDHKILLDKLKYYGITGIEHTLLSNYLHNRFQYITYDNTCSSFSSIDTGVPQGSILGPLLFLIYINDLPYSSTKLSFIMFADDTTLSCTTKQFDANNNTSNIEKALNLELSHIYDWLRINKLQLNISKTKFMLFHSKKKVVPSLKLQFGESDIVQVHTHIFLGLVLDSNLCWKPHINMISNKLSKTVGILNILKHTYPQRILLLLYNTLILPHLTYCLLCWGKITHTKRLQIIKKNSITNNYIQ